LPFGDRHFVGTVFSQIMLSLFDTAQVHRWAKHLHRLQRNSWIVYGAALGAILIATLIRWAMGGFVHDRIPFTTYYPAIVVATLLGGFWLGMLASILSATIAWWLFMPPIFGFALDAAQLTSLITFIFVCFLLVGTVTALNSAIDLLLVEIDHRQKTQFALGQLRAVAETSQDAIVTKDLNGIITSWNKGAERIFGYEADEVIGQPVSLLSPAERHDEEPAILERIRCGQSIEHYETVRRRKDGGLIDISLTVSPLADATGTIVGASKIARDITDKKRAQTRQELLLREMGHRVKNAFTLVNGIVGLSARYAKPKNLVTDIQARLAALARAHDLTRPGLLSAESQETQSMPFRALIDAIFAPYLDSNMSGNFQRLTVVGPDLLVHQTSITSLALVLYELATNAVKCGSLSLPAGRVQITLSLVDDRFELEWRERGGPKLTEAPNHEGFGTNLVRRVVAEQFRGEVVYDWNAEGLVVRLMTPSHQVLNVSKVETSA
jgi:PAS domain S-box-containing protein